MENKRWLYATVGTVILLLAGLIYAWSVISSPIAAFFPEWTKAQLSLTFSISMSFFCIAGVLSGMLSKKVNIKMNMILSGIVFFAGFFLVSRADSLMQIYIGYGVLGGFASGFVYNGVMTCVTKWYTDKPGFISGILLMGFGVGSFIIGKIYEAVTPAGPGVDEWRNTFFIFGVILLVMLVLGAFVMKSPGPDYIAPQPVQKTKNPKLKTEQGIDVGPAGMLKRVSFWLYIIWATALCVAGLSLIAQASGIALEVNPAASASTIATVAGAISIANGIGRVIVGILFDKIGRRAAMFVVDISFIIATSTLLFALTSHNFVLIVIAFALSGLSFGGVTPMNSVFARTFYGDANYAVNYPIINLNLLVSSFGSTLTGALYDASGSFVSSVFLMLAMVIIATISSIFLRRA